MERGRGEANSREQGRESKGSSRGGIEKSGEGVVAGADEESGLAVRGKRERRKRGGGSGVGAGAGAREGAEEEWRANRRGGGEEQEGQREGERESRERGREGERAGRTGAEE